MKTLLFQIFDKTAESVVGPIMAFPKQGPAIRAFNETCAQKDSMVNKYPEQYELVCVGEQDTDTGIIYPIGEEIENTHDDPQTRKVRQAWIIDKPIVVATGTQWAESQGEAPPQLKRA